MIQGVSIWEAFQLVVGGWTDNVAGWHDVGVNMGFLDGHSEYVKWSDPKTPTLFVTRGDFRNHPDKIKMMKAYTGGLVKP